MRAWSKVVWVLLLAGGAACSSSSEGSAKRSDGSALPESAEHDADEGSAGGTAFANGAPGGAAVIPPSAMTASGPSAGASGAGGAGASVGDSAAGPSMMGSAGSAGVPLTMPGVPTTTTTTNPNPQAGTLTAGAWDDNRNFERFSQYRSDLLQRELPGALPTEDSEHAAAHDKFKTGPTAHQLLDVALIIDTTGSMGDEITYLQTELVAISNEIKAAYPDAQQRWALIAYRDQGDAYVVQTTDFGADVSAYNTKLAGLSAGGGGDIPEAPEVALAEMVALDWRAEADVARLAFWVADAPHHNQNAPALADAIRDSAELGVHIYPVASSGINELMELSMRSSAQLTGGRYLFLTDDSGVGGAHKEPTIPCYFVTRLDRAITRMIDIEMSGEYHEPAKDDIVRTGGDPEDGACKLESGDQVVAF